MRARRDLLQAAVMSLASGVIVNLPVDVVCMALLLLCRIVAVNNKRLFSESFSRIDRTPRGPP
jgi:type IV secretory pathway VirB3-like protein